MYGRQIVALFGRIKQTTEIFKFGQNQKIFKRSVKYAIFGERILCEIEKVDKSFENR
jgi:hypothetical protein